jgi:hypothetical protein
MRALRLIAAVFALSLPSGVAAPGSYDPGGFGCLWPINNLFEDTALSRYYFDSAERVYRLKVYVNEPAPPQKSLFDDLGVSIGVGSTGPHKVVVCKIVPPHLESLRRAAYWHEIGVPRGQNSDAYRNIDIREAGTGGTQYDYIVLTPKSAAVSGVAVIEFHVYTGYASYAL